MPLLYGAFSAALSVCWMLMRARQDFLCRLPHARRLPVARVYIHYYVCISGKSQMRERPGGCPAVWGGYRMGESMSIKCQFRSWRPPKHP